MASIFKPVSHVFLLSKLAMAYEQATKTSVAAEGVSSKQRQQPQPASPLEASQHPVTSTKAKILVVEDNKGTMDAQLSTMRLVLSLFAVNNRVLCQILTKSNYTAHAAFNGKEALAAMQQESYDMVLMDVFMPVMDGIECTKELRQMGFHCPIIAVSATINEEACLTAGVTGMLPIAWGSEGFASWRR